MVWIFPNRPPRKMVEDWEEQYGPLDDKRYRRYDERRLERIERELRELKDEIRHLRASGYSGLESQGSSSVATRQLP